MKIKLNDDYPLDLYFVGTIFVDNNKKFCKYPSETARYLFIINPENDQECFAFDRFYMGEHIKCKIFSGENFNFSEMNNIDDIIVRKYVPLSYYMGYELDDKSIEEITITPDKAYSIYNKIDLELKKVKDDDSQNTKTI